jgi:hypothetical protein
VGGCPLNDAQGLLRIFFGRGNGLSYEQIVESNDPKVKTLIEPSIHEIIGGGIGFLPRTREDSTVWYGIATSEPHTREMRELVQAFLGPSYTSFRGVSLPFDHEDRIDRAVLSFSNGKAIKFEVWPIGSHQQRSSVNSNLLRLNSLRLAAPTRAFREDRPPWRVLRDFEFALADDSAEFADRYLTELIRSNALGEPNATFLTVRYLAHFGRWDELAGRPEFRWLVQTRRPPKVTSALMAAVYHARFEPLLASGGERLWNEVREVSTLYGNLFRSDPHPLTREGAIATVLVAAAASPQRMEQARRVHSKAAQLGLDLRTPLGGVAAELDAFLTEPTVAPKETEDSDPIAVARAAWHKGDAEASFRAAVGAPESIERTWLLIQATGVIQTLEVAQATIKAIETLGADQQHLLTNPLFEGVIADVQRLAAGQADLPADWMDWTHRVIEDPGFTSAREVAERGESEWSTDQLTDDEIAEFADALGDVPEASAELLVQAVPAILRAFPPERAARPHIAIYFQLLQRLGFRSHVSQQELETAETLVEVILQLGPTEQQYVELLELCELLWILAASPSAVDWALDVFHLLAHYPTRARDHAAGFIQSVLSRVSQWPQVLDRATRESLISVGNVRDVDVDSFLPAPIEDVAKDETDLWARLAGKRVGIYTLTESAATQAAQVLGRLVDGCTVVSNSDRDCTKPLAALAQNADLFVMVTRSAKHAATDCITGNRPDGPLLIPKGKGTSSIIRSIQAFLSDSV